VVLQIFAVTDVGQTREHNEDAFLVANLSGGPPMSFDRLVEQPADGMGTLFMVADGMGGAAAGEIASATAVDVVLRHLREGLAGQSRVTPDDFVKQLISAAEIANRAIFDYAARHLDLRGMGTTATIAALLGDTLYLAQVGDSRAYIVRDGAAIQITKDQSLMQKLIEAGELTEAEAAMSERRNIILQALGPEPIVKLDLTHQKVRRGDVLVLCSDGLSGLVKPEQIARAVEEELDLSTACERLVAMANDLGGPDNITVVAVRFEGEGLDVAHRSDDVGYRVFTLGGERPTAELEAALRHVTAQTATAPLAQQAAISDEDAETRRRRGQIYSRVIAAIGVALLVVAVLRIVLG
jgi:protein phosphatase